MAETKDYQTLVTIVQDIVWISLSLCMLCNIGNGIYILFLTHSLRQHVLQISHTELVDATQPAAMFNDYLRDFNKNYNNQEMEERFRIFKDSLKEIYRLNQETGAIHGLTKFSDMTKEEVFPSASQVEPTKCHSLSKPCLYEYSNELCDISQLNFTVPDKYDWRAEGKVGPVLDQKLCNGCWAFAIVEVMESIAAIRHVEYDDIRLSIQEVLDCTDNPTACSGGHVLKALFSLCEQRRSIVPEEEYPLVLVSKNCTLPANSGGIKIKHYCRSCEPSSNEILRLLAHHGPVMTVVNAIPWMHYTGGVIQRACFSDDTKLKHVVQIVGYDKTTEVPHYIVRNSWGEDFGDAGYVKLALDDEENVCGVRDEIYFLDVY